MLIIDRRFNNNQPIHNRPICGHPYDTIRYELRLNMVNIIYKELSYKITGLAMKVHRQLGYGFLEKVNENALSILLRREGLKVQTQHPITVHFEGEVVGQYFADVLVEDKILLELKVAERISSRHMAQTLNYLRATNLKPALILNFGPKRLESHRVVN